GGRPRRHPGGPRRRHPGPPPLRRPVAVHHLAVPGGDQRRPRRAPPPQAPSRTGRAGRRPGPAGGTGRAGGGGVGGRRPSRRRRRPRRSEPRVPGGGAAARSVRSRLRRDRRAARCPDRDGSLPYRPGPGGDRRPPPGTGRPSRTPNEMTMDATPDRLDPHHLDDGTLSALLDGDAGDGPDAAAHLRACDRCAARQAELAGARAALAAAPVEPLDELTRRRLVGTALRAADPAAPGDGRLPGAAGRHRRLPRHPALVGSAAAVVLALLVGVPFVLGDLSGRDQLRLRLSGSAGNSAERNFATSAPGQPAAPASGGATPADAPLAAPTPAGPPGAETTTLGPQAAVGGSAGAAKSAAPAADTYSGPEQQAAVDRARADTDACVAALLDGPARGGRLTRSGTGTYRGRPAVVAAFELSGGTVAFVTDRSGCAVLDRFTY